MMIKDNARMPGILKLTVMTVLSLCPGLVQSQMTAAVIPTNIAYIITTWCGESLDNWVTVQACASVKPRFVGPAKHVTIWDLNSVEDDISPYLEPLATPDYEWPKLFENFKDNIKQNAASNDPATCGARAKVPPDFNVSPGSCNGATFLAHPHSIKASYNEAAASTPESFSVIMQKSIDKLVYCIYCTDNNGAIVWANPFTTQYDYLARSFQFPEANPKFYDVIRNHVFITYAGVSNVLTYTAALYEEYLVGQYVVKEWTTNYGPAHIPRCKFELTYPIIGTTEATGWLDEISITVDTSIDWPQTEVFLECHEYAGETWQTTWVTRIPFFIEVQPVPDCSVGWFTIYEYTSSPVGPKWMPGTDVWIFEEKFPITYVHTPDDLLTEVSSAFKAWDQTYCSNMTEVVFHFAANDTVIDPADFAGETWTIPSFEVTNITADAPSIMMRQPDPPHNYRFDAEIYWTFRVLSPAGPQAGVIRSNNKHVVVCHDSMPVTWTPHPNTMNFEIDKGKQIQALFPFAYTIPDYCRETMSSIFETDGVTPHSIIYLVNWGGLGSRYFQAHNVTGDTTYLRTVQTLVFRELMNFTGHQQEWRTQGDMVNRDITINFFCGPESAIIGAAATTVKFQKVEASSGLLQFFQLHPSSWSTNLINCDVQTVEVTSFDTQVLHPNLLQKDTAEKVFLSSDFVTERVETFNLTINDVNGTYIFGPFDLDIGCTLVNLTYSPAIVGVFVDPMDHNNETIWPIPTISNVEVGYPHCFSRINTIVSLTVNASTSGPIVYWNDSANCNVNNISCDFLMFDTLVLLNAMPGEKVQITFNITTQISPQEFRTSGMITIDACHFRSTEIEGYWPQMMDNLQVVADGPQDGFFTSRMYQSTFTGCPVIHMELSLDNITFTGSLPGMLVSPVQVPGGMGEWHIAAENRSLHGVYKFYVRAYAKGGKHIGDSINTLVVGCHANYSNTALPDTFNMNPEHFPRENMDFHVEFPDLYPHNWCQVWKVEPLEIILSMYIPPPSGEIPDSLNWEDCPQPCTVFKLFEEATRPNTTTTFIIRYHIGHNMTFDTENITITVLDCQKGTATISNNIDIGTFISRPRNSEDNLWQVNNFVCDYSHCCKGMITGLTLDDPATMDMETEIFSNYSMVQVDRVLWNTFKIVIAFPTAVLRTMTFKVYQQSNMGNWAISDPVTIFITEENYENQTYAELLILRVDGDDQANGTVDLEFTQEEDVVVEEVVEEEPEELGEDLNIEESMDILEEFSKYHSLSHNSMYSWKNGQLASDKLDYVPYGMDEAAFLKKTKFKARIQKIGNTGRCTIKFDTVLKDQNTGTLLKSIDPQIMFISVIPSENTQKVLEAEGRLAEEVLNISKWFASSFVLDKLDIMIEFHNPLEISSHQDRDWLQVVFVKNEFFTDKAGRMRLEKKSTRLVFPLPNQMKNDNFGRLLAESEETIENGMNAFAIIQVGINVLVSVSLSQLLAMISSLNIICFSSMIKTDQPPNKQYVNGIFVRILGAEVIDPSWSTELIFDFEPDEEYINDLLINDKLDSTSMGANIYDLGFETFNPILNSGGFYIIYIATLMLMGAIILVKVVSKMMIIISSHMPTAPATQEGGSKSKLKSCCKKCKKKSKKAYKGLENDLFFAVPITLVTEQVFYVCVTLMLFFYSPAQLMEKQYETNRMTYYNGYGFTMLCVLCAFILIPLVMFKVPFTKYRKLKKSTFQQYFGSVYSDLYVQKRINKWYPFISYARKLTMVFIAFVINVPVGVKIILLFYLNLASLIFTGNNRPFNSHFKNKVNIFNEGCICLMSLQIVLETDFCGSLDLRYNSGYVFIMFLFLNVGVNVYQIFQPSVRYLVLCMKWLYRRICKYTKMFQLWFCPTLFKKKQRKQKHRPVLAIEIPKEKPANILKLDSEEGKLTELQKNFYKAVENLEMNLVTKQMAVFKTWRRTQMDEYRAGLLRNGLERAYNNTFIMKRMTTLSDYEKCRLVFEYHTYIEFKMEWTSITRGISTHKQQNSFDSFFKSYITQYSDQLDDNTVDMDRIKSWEEVSRAMVDKKKPEDGEEFWYFQEFTPFWMFDVEYTTSEFEQFARDYMPIVDEDGYNKVYTKLEQNLNKDNKFEDRVQIKKLWQDKQLIRCSRVQDRANLVQKITSKSVGSSISEEDKNKFMSQRIEQLYQLLFTQCEIVSSSFKSQAKKKGFYTYSIDEYIWDQIRELTKESFRV